MYSLCKDGGCCIEFRCYVTKTPFAGASCHVRTDCGVADWNNILGLHLGLKGLSYDLKNQVLSHVVL